MFLDFKLQQALRCGFFMEGYLLDLGSVFKHPLPPLSSPKQKIKIEAYKSNEIKC